MTLARGTARRYAEAAFQIAERDDTMAAWTAAFALAEDRLTQAQVMRLLANPSLPTTARIEVLDRILAEEVEGAPRSLLALMLRRGRFELLPDVIREFKRLQRRRDGIVEALVTSAVPLQAGEVAAIEARLVAMTGSTVELHQQVDPGLLGGLTVRVGDQLIDGSVRGRLERLRSEFTSIAI
jgi:F-type H+-transporting ATPase subunit delta